MHPWRPGLGPQRDLWGRPNKHIPRVHSQARRSRQRSFGGAQRQPTGSDREQASASLVIVLQSRLSTAWSPGAHIGLHALRGTKALTRMFSRHAGAPASHGGPRRSKTALLDQAIDWCGRFSVGYNRARHRDRRGVRNDMRCRASRNPRLSCMNEDTDKLFRPGLDGSMASANIGFRPRK